MKLWFVFVLTDRCVEMLEAELRIFAGDLNETFFVGKVDEDSEKLVRTTYECLEKAIATGEID
jgi:methionine aminopeptidase